MAEDGAELKGRKVLVVEDVLLVAEVISEALEMSGCDIVGPVARLDRALVLAREAPLDGAVLDVNLAGKSSFPIAEALERRGIPFMFVTGYDVETALPPKYHDVPRLAKPFHVDRLVGLAAEHFHQRIAEV